MPDPGDAGRTVMMRRVVGVVVGVDEVLTWLLTPFAAATSSTARWML
jgi:hypothetical protein